MLATGTIRRRTGCARGRRPASQPATAGTDGRMPRTSSRTPCRAHSWVSRTGSTKRAGSILNASGAAYVNAFQKAAVEESRLKIPLLFGLDVIHGYETIFPVPLAQAASWDLEAIERAETVAAREASAAGIRWTFSPMVMWPATRAGAG